ncbi:hypothetical protein BDC45DRAFT_539629 [Circinella umbellata]|nr:hypothetical protein BDC45DRAFT_539629 [Circinella umbellata]
MKGVWQANIVWRRAQVQESFMRYKSDKDPGVGVERDSSIQIMDYWLKHLLQVFFYPDLKGKFFQLVGSKGIQIIQVMRFPYSALFILMIKNLYMKSPSSKICLETVVKSMPYDRKTILTVFIMKNPDPGYSIFSKLFVHSVKKKMRAPIFIKEVAYLNKFEIPKPKIYKSFAGH